MPNRLAGESSPYLRQHADNPVDWYPWGSEAFERARSDEKPILLSVGYASCHWCHVMAHESFEDPGTAEELNRLFVNVKVDREERPEIDAIYMEAVTAMTGHGGWPMTVFLTPDGRPFFGGTYFPRERRGGMPSFLDVCRAVAEAWNERRDDVLHQADRLTAALGRLSVVPPAGMPSEATITGAVALMREQHDSRWGGFGSEPKFPHAMALDFLAAYNLHERDPEVDALITLSLDAMASGGMYDHLGGGFARYSVDRYWLVPHFEKMLYDQALLARAYLHAWLASGEARWLQVASEVIEYVLRDLRHPEGGFFSSEDADSEGEEGRFYLWTIDELRNVLGADAGPASEWWGVTEQGNFEGRNILHRPVRGDLLRPPEIEDARRRLFEARSRRVRPGLDDKVLVEWNGLMLSTLAEAARATGIRRWHDAALACGEFLLSRMRDAEGRWLRSWQQNGGARHMALAADHSALLDAFVRLGELTGEARWIAEAERSAAELIGRFWDAERGGLYTTADDAEALVTRPKDLIDNATPSANSLAALGLLRLAALTGESSYQQRAEETLRLLTPLAATSPLFASHALLAIDLYVGGSVEIAVVGDRPDLMEVLNRRWLPHAVLAWGESYQSPLWEGREPGWAYVCRHFTCQAPAGTVAQLEAALEPT